ncbi:MAG: hypothetical protein EKK63_10045 [Acinetobacter sp.]|uniref:hypothetical protein n=1 Tax=Acinetobacter sp. TaxID=472 RepID=UPI000F94AF69|nr:hypothetical protein [Acinetobacter sp.]RUP39331.1 MAG: hypothetical protein EKK63_10045 [Acinetobacter sp.]
MKYTLIELVQRILESMDSDEVDSINDSPESLAVANVVKECYFDIVGKLDLPEKESIFQMTPSGDSNKPTLMYLPENIINLQRMKYNSASVSDPNWYDLNYLPWDDFLDMQNGLLTTETNVGSMTIIEDGHTFTFKYRNDVLPQFYASFNDRTILFDSYDSLVNTTLVASKTMCFGSIEPDFTLSDTFVPELDAQQFQLLLQASKAQAFVELKQVENPKAERKERKNEILAQRTKHAIDRRGGSQTYRRYGRK